MQLFAPSIGMLGNAGFPTFFCEICSKTGSLSVGLDNNLIELIYMTAGDICHNNIRRVTDKVFSMRMIWGKILLRNLSM